MPSVSQNQAIAMRIAEHAPDKLYPRNKGMLKMSHSQLHDFSVTKSAGLPKKKRPKHPMAAMLGESPEEEMMEMKRGNGPKGKAEEALEKKRGINPRTGD